MRKFFILLLSILVFTSCKKKDKNEVTAVAEKTQPITCDFNDETIIVDDSKIPNLSDWETTNSNVICSTTQIFQKCFKNEIVVNLSNIKNTSERALWLKDNCKYICFEDSNLFIEKSHFIPLSTSDIVRLKPNPPSMTKHELDSKINFISDTTTSDDYDKWVNFSIDKTSNKVLVNEVSKFDENSHCYSRPLLKFILKS